MRKQRQRGSIRGALARAANATAANARRQKRHIFTAPWTVILALLLVGCNFPVKVDLRVFPTATPTQTLTPTPTPTQTPSPTPSPTPTLPPAVRVEHAEEAMFLGDYALAYNEFANALSAASDSQLKAAAALGIGRALYFQKDYEGAIETLEAMTAAYPDDPHGAAAYYFLGQAYETQQMYAEAAQAYGKYQEKRPGILDDFIHELRGNALLAAGDPAGAAAAFEAAITSSGPDGASIWTELKLARTYSQTRDYKNSIKRYLEIYGKTDNEYARAQANYLMAQDYLSMGLPEQAFARLQDSVINYPRTYDSYTGLVQLVNSGQPVDELARGKVDYFAGQHGLAVEAFNRYIDSTPDPDAAAFYYRALSRQAMGEPGNAVDDLNIVIENYTNDDYWAKAWDEKAYIQWTSLNKFPEAAQTYLKFVELAPDAPEAPDFLFWAARVYERNNQLTEAAAVWERMIDEYPAATNSYRGLFLAGVSQYRAGDYAKAQQIFQRCLVLATAPNEQAAAGLWVGKAQQAQGDLEGMRASWQQAAQRDPTGYYSERANELLLDRKPFVLTKAVDLGYDLAKERVEAETWMRTTFDLPEETNFTGLGELANDAHMQRGAAFWELGLYEQARNEYEIARKAVLNDPLATYRLMNHLYEQGVYRSALLASRHILDLAHLDDVGTLQAPAYFNHIRFGIYFKDLVVPASQEEGFSPLFVLSVMRQESLFEGFAISVSGARGLMQIMPATGQEIATNMRWPEGYSEDDLYRPAINIPMGANYLARQRDYFGGDLFAALAAYNGGPGNTIIWRELAGDDPDLLLEVIRAEETRKYITQIHEFFNLYRLLYESKL